jgi:hypothetical protein
MDPTTAQVLVSAVIRGLDLIGRVAEKQFDSREELEAYIAERNQVRKELVALAIELGGGNAAEPKPVESDDDQEEDDAASPAPSQD